MFTEYKVLVFQTNVTRNATEIQMAKSLDKPMTNSDPVGELTRVRNVPSVVVTRFSTRFPPFFWLGIELAEILHFGEIHTVLSKTSINGRMSKAANALPLDHSG